MSSTGGTKGAPAEADIAAEAPSSLRLDVASGTLWRGTVPFTLRPKTLAVLECLVGRSGAVVGRDELHQAVWGKKHGSEHGPKQCIRELRVLFEDTAATPRFIETVGRRGYRFIGDLALSGRQNDDRSSSTVPPGAPLCVGRERELAELGAGLATARKGARPIYLLSGEAGAGKTTLTDSFVSSLSGGDDLWIARGQCLPHHGPREPYAPLFEALESLAIGPAGASFVKMVPDCAPSLLKHLPSVFSRNEIAAKQIEMAGLGAERMLRELTDLMERLTQRTPGLLVIEDLHWSDSSTLAWLRAWSLRRAPARLMILTTCRSEDTDENSLTTALRELSRYSGFHRVELAGLTATAISEYLDSRFPIHSFPDTLAKSLAEHTEGRAIFVTALIEEWLTHGVLQNDSGNWVLRGDVKELTTGVPASIQALIDGQIAALARAERQVLDAASVAGQMFSAAALAENPAAVETVEQQCEDLARRRLFIQRCGTTTWPNGTTAALYGFRHTLYQQALYANLPAATCKGWHRRIGIRLEAAYGEHARDLSSALAVHFEEADDWSRAALYHRLSGEVALERGAAREAAAQLRHALGLISLCPESRVRLQAELLTQMSLGAALIAADGFAEPELRTVYGRAHTLSEQLPETMTPIPALYGLWNYHLTRAEFQTANSLATRLEALATPDAAASVRMAAHMAAEITHWFAGEYARVPPHVEAVLKIYDRQRDAGLFAMLGEDPAVVSHQCAAIVHQLLGSTETAERHFTEGMEVARALNQPFGMAQMLWAGAIIARERGDLPITKERALELIATCERADSTFWLPGGRVVAGWAVASGGDVGAGLEEIRRGMDAWREGDIALTRPYSLAVFADACGRCGHIAEGLAALVEARSLARTTGEHWYDAELHRLIGELTLRKANDADSQATAIRELRQAVDIARGQQAKQLEDRAAASLAQALERSRDESTKVAG